MVRTIDIAHTYNGTTTYSGSSVSIDGLVHPDPISLDAGSTLIFSGTPTPDVTLVASGNLTIESDTIDLPAVTASTLITIDQTEVVGEVSATSTNPQYADLIIRGSTIQAPSQLTLPASFDTPIIAANLNSQTSIAAVGSSDIDTITIASSLVIGDTLGTASIQAPSGAISGNTDVVDDGNLPAYSTFGAGVRTSDTVETISGPYTPIPPPLASPGTITRIVLDNVSGTVQPIIPSAAVESPILLLPTGHSIGYFIEQSSGSPDYMFWVDTGLNTHLVDDLTTGPLDNRPHDITAVGTLQTVTSIGVTGTTTASQLTTPLLTVTGSLSGDSASITTQLDVADSATVLGQLITDTLSTTITPVQPELATLDDLRRSELSFTASGTLTLPSDMSSLGLSPIYWIVVLNLNGHSVTVVDGLGSTYLGLGSSIISGDYLHISWTGSALTVVDIGSFDVRRNKVMNSLHVLTTSQLDGLVTTSAVEITPPADTPAILWNTSNTLVINGDTSTLTPGSIRYGHLRKTSGSIDALWTLPTGAAMDQGESVGSMFRVLLINDSSSPVDVVGATGFSATAIFVAPLSMSELVVIKEASSAYRLLAIDRGLDSRNPSSIDLRTEHVYINGATDSQPPLVQERIVSVIATDSTLTTTQLLGGIIETTASSLTLPADMSTVSVDVSGSFEWKLNNEGTEPCVVVGNTGITLVNPIVVQGKSMASIIALKTGATTWSFHSTSLPTGLVLSDIEVGALRVDNAISRITPVVISGTVITLSTSDLQSGYISGNMAADATWTSPAATDIISGLSLAVNESYTLVIGNPTAFSITLVGGLGVTVLSDIVHASTSLIATVLVSGSSTVTILLSGTIPTEICANTLAASGAIRAGTFIERNPIITLTGGSEQLGLDLGAFVCTSVGDATWTLPQSLFIVGLSDVGDVLSWSITNRSPGTVTVQRHALDTSSTMIIEGESLLVRPGTHVQLLARKVSGVIYEILFPDTATNSVTLDTLTVDDVAATTIAASGLSRLADARVDKIQSTGSSGVDLAIANGGTVLVASLRQGLSIQTPTVFNHVLVLPSAVDIVGEFSAMEDGDVIEWTLYNTSSSNLISVQSNGSSTVTASPILIQPRSCQRMLFRRVSASSMTVYPMVHSDRMILDVLEATISMRAPEVLSGALVSESTRTVVSAATTLTGSELVGGLIDITAASSIVVTLPLGTSVVAQSYNINASSIILFRNSSAVSHTISPTGTAGVDAMLRASKTIAPSSTEAFILERRSALAFELYPISPHLASSLVVEGLTINGVLNSNLRVHDVAASTGVLTAAAMAGGGVITLDGTLTTVALPTGADLETEIAGTVGVNEAWTVGVKNTSSNIITVINSVGATLDGGTASTIQPHSTIGVRVTRTAVNLYTVDLIGAALPPNLTIESLTASSLSVIGSIDVGSINQSRVEACGGTISYTSEPTNVGVGQVLGRRIIFPTTVSVTPRTVVLPSLAGELVASGSPSVVDGSIIDIYALDEATSGGLAIVQLTSPDVFRDPVSGIDGSSYTLRRRELHRFTAVQESSGFVVYPPPSAHFGDLTGYTFVDPIVAPLVSSRLSIPIAATGTDAVEVYGTSGFRVLDSDTVVLTMDDLRYGHLLKETGSTPATWTLPTGAELDALQGFVDGNMLQFYIYNESAETITLGDGVGVTLVGEGSFPSTISVQLNLLRESTGVYKVYLVGSTAGAASGGGGPNTGVFTRDGLYGTDASPIDGGTFTLDLETSLPTCFELSAGASSLTLNGTAPTVTGLDKRGIIVFIERSEDGRTITFPTFFQFYSGAAPTKTTSNHNSGGVVVDLLEYYSIRPDLVIARWHGNHEVLPSSHGGTDLGRGDKAFSNLYLTGSIVTVSGPTRVAFAPTDWQILKDHVIPTFQEQNVSALKVLFDGVGSSHSIYATDGKINVFGENANGELGIGGSAVTQKLPFQFTDPSGVISVGVGTQFSLVVTDTGAVWASGRNDSGQLGLGDTTNRYTWTQMAALPTTPRLVSCGVVHTIILCYETDGGGDPIDNTRVLYVMGGNSHGQIGLATQDAVNPTPTLMPLPVEPGVGTAILPSTISCGANHSLISTTLGSAWGLGGNAVGQLGADPVIYPEILTPRILGDLAATTFTAHDQVISVKAGHFFSGLMQLNGRVLMAGDNTHGQIGDGTTNVVVGWNEALADQGGGGELGGSMSLGCGGDHCMLILHDGTLRAWGNGTDGQLSTQVSNYTTPTSVTSPAGTISNPAFVTCGEKHTLLSTLDGRLFGSGSNDVNQLGLFGGATSVTAWTQVYDNMSALAVNSTPTLYGSVSGWGDRKSLIYKNGKGDWFGYDDCSAYALDPTAATSYAHGMGSSWISRSEACYMRAGYYSGVPGMKHMEWMPRYGIKKVAIGTNFVVVLRTDGAVFTNQGVLSSYVRVLRPGGDEPLEEVCDIACGDNHWAAVTESSRVVCAGDNSQGQCAVDPVLFPTVTVPVYAHLGNGDPILDTDCDETPRCLEYLLKVACTRYGTAALSEHGRVYSWGESSNLPVLGRGSLLAADAHYTPSPLVTRPVQASVAMVEPLIGVNVLVERVDELHATKDSIIARTRDGGLFMTNVDATKVGDALYSDCTVEVPPINTNNDATSRIIEVYATPDALYAVRQRNRGIYSIGLNVDGVMGSTTLGSGLRYNTLNESDRLTGISSIVHVQLGASTWGVGHTFASGTGVAGVGINRAGNVVFWQTGTPLPVAEYSGKPYVVLKANHSGLSLIAVASDNSMVISGQPVQPSIGDLGLQRVKKIIAGSAGPRACLRPTVSILDTSGNLHGYGISGSETGGINGRPLLNIANNEAVNCSIFTNDIEETYAEGVADDIFYDFSQINNIIANSTTAHPTLWVLDADGSVSGWTKTNGAASGRHMVLQNEDLVGPARWDERQCPRVDPRSGFFAALTSPITKIYSGTDGLFGFQWVIVICLDGTAWAQVSAATLVGMFALSSANVLQQMKTGPGPTDYVVDAVDAVITTRSVAILTADGRVRVSTGNGGTGVTIPPMKNDPLLDAVANAIYSTPVFTAVGSGIELTGVVKVVPITRIPPGNIPLPFAEESGFAALLGTGEIVVWGVNMVDVGLGVPETSTSVSTVPGVTNAIDIASFCRVGSEVKLPNLSVTGNTLERSIGLAYINGTNGKVEIVLDGTFDGTLSCATAISDPTNHVTPSVMATAVDQADSRLYPSIAVYARAIAGHTYIHRTGSTEAEGFGDTGNGRLAENVPPASQLYSMGEGKTIAFPSVIRSMSTGVAHSCATLMDGRVYVWGDNTRSQCSLTSSTMEVYDHLNQITSNTALTTHGAQNAVCGGDHTVVLLTDGTIVSFGSNTHGQLGIGALGGADSSTGVTAAIPELCSIVGAGDGYTVALSTTGNVYFWGKSFTPSGAASGTPTIVHSANGTWLSAGRRHYAFISNSTVYAAGDPSMGKTGNQYAFGEVGLSEEGCDIPNPINIRQYTPVQVDCGENNTYILTDTQRVLSLGSNENFQLTGHTLDRSYETWTPYEAVEPGICAIGNIRNTLLFTKSGIGAVAMSYGNYNTRRVPGSRYSSSPGRTATIADLVDAKYTVIPFGSPTISKAYPSMGGNASRKTPDQISNMVTVDRGRITVAGDSNRLGTAGPIFRTHLDVGRVSFLKLEDYRFTSIHSASLDDYGSIGSAPSYMIAINDRGEAHTWSNDQSGSVINNTTSVPVVEAALSGIRIVWVAVTRTTDPGSVPVFFALSAAGFLYVWGGVYATYRVAGVTLSSTPTPAALVGGVPLGDIVSVAIIGTGMNVVALTKDGSLYASGTTAYHFIDPVSTPVAIYEDLTPLTVSHNVSTMTLGTDSLVYIDTSGDLYTVGGGQFNVGSTSPPTRPQPWLRSNGTDKFVKVVSGGDHAMAIRADGQLFSLGGAATDAFLFRTATTANGDRDLIQCTPTERAFDVACSNTQTLVLFEDPAEPIRGRKALFGGHSNTGVASIHFPAVSNDQFDVEIFQMHTGPAAPKNNPVTSTSCRRPLRFPVANVVSSGSWGIVRTLDAFTGLPITRRRNAITAIEEVPGTASLGGTPSLDTISSLSLGASGYLAGTTSGGNPAIFTSSSDVQPTMGAALNVGETAYGVSIAGILYSPTSYDLIRHSTSGNSSANNVAGHYHWAQLPVSRGLHRAHITNRVISIGATDESVVTFLHADGTVSCNLHDISSPFNGGRTTVADPYTSGFGSRRTHTYFRARNSRGLMGSAIQARIAPTFSGQSSGGNSSYGAVVLRSGRVLTAGNTHRGALGHAGILIPPGFATEHAVVPNFDYVHRFALDRSNYRNTTNIVPIEGIWHISAALGALAMNELSGLAFSTGDVFHTLAGLPTSWAPSLMGSQVGVVPVATSIKNNYHGSTTSTQREIGLSRGVECAYNEPIEGHTISSSIEGAQCFYTVLDPHSGGRVTGLVTCRRGALLSYGSSSDTVYNPVLRGTLRNVQHLPSESPSAGFTEHVDSIHNLSIGRIVSGVIADRVSRVQTYRLRGSFTVPAGIEWAGASFFSAVVVFNSFVTAAGTDYNMFDGSYPAVDTPVGGRAIFANATLQHRCFLGDGMDYLRRLPKPDDWNGMLVSASMNRYDSMELGPDTVEINTALPVVALTQKDADKAVFGVISLQADVLTLAAMTHRDFQLAERAGDVRMEINSVGEGCIWVVDTGGEIESGDFLCSSSVPGYGRRQSSPCMLNCTVGKATQACDFDRNALRNKRSRRESKYVTRVSDKLVARVYDNLIDFRGDAVYEKALKTRIVDDDGVLISPDDYDSQVHHIAAFIGCTYHAS